MAHIARFEEPLEQPHDSDRMLLEAVRSGDQSAYGDLWTRHADAAHRLARAIAPSKETDDLVSESFTRVLRVIREGGGPDTAFRPYLLSTVRRVAIDTGRTYSQRIQLTDDTEDLDTTTVVTPADKAVDHEEQRVVWAAWKSLPEESQTLLWHLLVEEETPAQLAPVLGITANGVSSRAKRAKERLRQAFLSEYVAGAHDEECRDIRRLMGAHVRDGLSSRDDAVVSEHLEDCDSCGAALLAISDTNAGMRILVLPVLLGGTAVATSYLASAGTTVVAGAAAGGAAAGAAGGASGGASAGGFSFWPPPGLTSPGRVGAAGGAAVAVVAVAAAAFGLVGSGGTEPSPPKPVSRATSAAPAKPGPAPAPAPGANPPAPAPKPAPPGSKPAPPAAQPSPATPPPVVVVTSSPPTPSPDSPAPTSASTPPSSSSTPPPSTPTKPRPTQSPTTRPTATPSSTTVPTSPPTTRPTTPPPPTHAPPEPVTMTFTFTPRTILPTYARLEATAGWQLVSLRGHDRIQRIPGPAETFEGYLPPGTSTLTVRSARIPDKGLLNARFTLTPLSLFPLPGSRTYPLTP
ncbi:sigma-70 family RNA polymerase sigma factor [Luteipulveratus mongoliensis]|uniref:sigma-70 family RNA polymerase sigma factor n=1 Tax=Luteipulveratus mongoliensis TaxID=571913 RepID=UPI000695C5A0|nr:sigma-70 family RNA polymerase sigma factor [Luteipulveratus mongoliensis]